MTNWNKQLGSWGLAVWLGLAVPIVPALLLPTIAQADSLPTGEFNDGTWSVTIRYSNNALTYYGENLNTGRSIFLSGATVGGSRSRRTYTWNNAGTRYVVTWQSADDSAIRVQVKNPNGREILNRLLYRSGD